MYHLLNKVLEDYKDLTFTFRYPVNILIKDKTLLTEEERKYVSHHNTHIDFLIYNKISKIPLLAVEVDGYKYHKEDNKQKERDILKNNILSKYNISLIRLTTNGSREKDIIINKLNNIINKYYYVHYKSYHVSLISVVISLRSNNNILMYLLYISYIYILI